MRNTRSSMNWLKQNRGLAAVLTGGLLSLMGESYLWQRGWHQVARLRAAQAQKKEERAALVRQSPGLNRENELAVADNLVGARQALVELSARLEGEDGDLPLPTPPARPAAAYFDLAAFVEKMRAEAAQAGVKIKPDERFGFASYVNEGPEDGLIPAVFRQRLAVEYIVRALLESHPRALLEVQREAPVTSGPRPPAAVKTAAGKPEDYFAAAGLVPLRVPGRLEGDVFRLEFTGQTPALREFLNTLAAFKRPVVVRSVEVEPLNAGLPATARAGPPAADDPVPLVAQNFSKFTVVVEMIRLIEPGEESGS